MAMETTREKRNILFCQFLFVFLRDHFRKRVSKFGTFQIIWSKNDQIQRIWWKNEINRILRFIELFDPPKYLISRIIWFVELFDCPNRLIHRYFWCTEFEKPEKSMVITSLVWMVSQNLLKSDFILTMEHNKFYWMVSHWNVTILKVRDLRTDQYMKKSYIFPIVKNFELLT